jgi:hypothetical protein
VARWGTRLALAAAAGAFAALLIAVALWFLGYSLFLLLVWARLNPAAAALIVAAIGLALAGLAGLGARRLLRPRPARPAAPAAAGGALDELAAQIGSLAARQTVASVRAHPYGAIGTALLAGLAVGALPELRRLLSGILKR